MGDLLYVVLRDRSPSISRIDRAVELAPPEIHTLRVATGHRGYAHTVFNSLADAVADLIRPLIDEDAHARTAPL